MDEPSVTPTWVTLAQDNTSGDSEGNDSDDEIEVTSLQQALQPMSSLQAKRYRDAAAAAESAGRPPKRQKQASISGSSQGSLNAGGSAVRGPQTRPGPSVSRTVTAIASLQRHDGGRSNAGPSAPPRYTPQPTSFSSTNADSRPMAKAGRPAPRHQPQPMAGSSQVNSSPNSESSTTTGSNSSQSSPDRQVARKTTGSRRRLPPPAKPPAPLASTSASASPAKPIPHEVIDISSDTDSELSTLPRDQPPPRCQAVEHKPAAPPRSQASKSSTAGQSRNVRISRSPSWEAFEKTLANFGAVNWQAGPSASAPTAGPSRPPPPQTSASVSKPNPAVRPPATPQKCSNLDGFVLNKGKRADVDNRPLNKALNLLPGKAEQSPATKKARSSGGEDIASAIEAAGKQNAQGFRLKSKNNAIPKILGVGASKDSPIVLDSDEDLASPSVPRPPSPRRDVHQRNPVRNPLPSASARTSRVPSRATSPTPPNDDQEMQSPPPPPALPQRRPPHPTLLSSVNAMSATTPSSSTPAPFPAQQIFVPPLPRRPTTNAGPQAPPNMRKLTEVGMHQQQQRPAGLPASPIRRHTFPVPAASDDRGSEQEPVPPITRIATPPSAAPDSSNSAVTGPSGPPMSPASNTPSPEASRPPSPLVLVPIVRQGQAAPPARPPASGPALPQAKAKDAVHAQSKAPAATKPMKPTPATKPKPKAPAASRLSAAPKPKKVFVVDSDGDVDTEEASGGDDVIGNTTSSESEESEQEEAEAVLRVPHEAPRVHQRREPQAAKDEDEEEVENARQAVALRTEKFRREVLAAEEEFADNEDDGQDEGDAQNGMSLGGLNLFPSDDEDENDLAAAPSGPDRTSSPTEGSIDASPPYQAAAGDTDHDEDMEVNNMLAQLPHDMSLEIDDVADALGSQRLATTSISEGYLSSRPGSHASLSRRSSPDALVTTQPPQPQPQPQPDPNDSFDDFYVTDPEEGQDPVTSASAAPTVHAHAAAVLATNQSDSDDPLSSFIPSALPRTAAVVPRLPRSNSVSSSSVSSGPLTPDPSDTPAAPSSAKCYGGITTSTFNSFRDTYEPEFRTSEDLRSDLYDYIHSFSEHFKRSQSMRSILTASIAYNTMEERHAPEIQITNEVDDEPVPPWEFYYTNHMYHGKDVAPPDVKNLRGCDCIGKCDPKCKDCACVQKQRKWVEYETGFAYDKQGRLKASYFAHLPVFECNDLCGCDSDCMNRVVQQGRTVQISLKKTPHKGWGIFAGAKKIPIGSFLGIYSGELLTDNEAHERGLVYNEWGRTYLMDIASWFIRRNRRHEKRRERQTRRKHRPRRIDEGPYPEDPDSEDDNEGEILHTIDAYHAGNFTRFLNHSCDPNARPLPVYINEGDIEKPILVLYAIRDIEPFEEVCFDYNGTLYDDDREEQEEIVKGALKDKSDAIYEACRCGSKKCTGKMFR